MQLSFGFTAINILDFGFLQSAIKINSNSKLIY